MLDHVPAMVYSYMARANSNRSPAPEAYLSLSPAPDPRPAPQALAPKPEPLLTPLRPTLRLALSLALRLTLGGQVDENNENPRFPRVSSGAELVYGVSAQARAVGWGAGGERR